MREAAFALGKTRITTIRRVLLPSVRSNMATGVTLGISRIIGDTAIVVMLLAERRASNQQSSVPGLELLRGTGPTLTSYVYDNSPAGEGAAPKKAYAAAFVLLLFVLGLNLLVERIGRHQQRATGLSAPPGSCRGPCSGQRGRFTSRYGLTKLSTSVKMVSQMGNIDVAG